MASALQTAAGAAHQQGGQVVVVVPVAVAEAAAVEHHRRIEQGALAFFDGRQAVDVVGEHLGEMAVDLLQPLDEHPVAAVVRQRVVRVGHPDFGVGAVARLVPQHEGGDPGQVGLPGEHLQVEHQLGVVDEAVGHARRLVHRRQLARRLPLGRLDAPLDVAHRVEVLVQLHLVAGAQLFAQPRRLGRHHVEQAAVVPPGGQPGRGVGGAAGAEQPLEDGARVAGHRQRGRGAAPAQGVGVGAAIAGVARPGPVGRLQRQLERGELRLLAEHAGRDLVHRDAGPDVVPFGLLRVHAGQEGAGRARVVAGPFAGAGDALFAAQPADEEHAVAVRRQRPKRLGDVEGAGAAGRGPVLHVHAVRHVDDPQPADRLGRAGAEAERRRHAVEHRQRQGHAEAAEERAAREVLLGDNHGSRDLLI